LTAESARINSEYNQIIKNLQEGLGGIRDVLINGTQEVHIRAYRESDLRLRRSTGNVHIIGTMPRYIVEALGMVLIAVIAYLMLVAEGSTEETVIILGLFALAAQRMLPLIQQVYVGLTSIRGNVASLGEVVTLLNQPLPEYAYSKPKKPLLFAKSIELRNLCFKYGDVNKEVLFNISLKIPKGARVGIIGATGCGKSTLIDILMGLLEPTSGVILVDNNELTLANRRAWQLNISHVPQSIYLSDTTIAENIALSHSAKDKIDPHRVRWAAKIAQIDKEIDLMPNGYNTFVGERGGRLSGGQRQRIGIARAVYNQTDVLFLDEATSGLDLNTETNFINMLENLPSELSVIMVAHNITTLKNCTMIIEIRNGNLFHLGSYDDYILSNKDA
jgi:ATP-binding cassette subfamily B protein